MLNALVEKEHLELLSGDTANVRFPETYHTAFWCPECATYVWSEYRGGYFEDCWFVRVGTLDEPDLLPPDVHIFTESKQPWVILPEGIPIYKHFYPIEEVWDENSIARLGTDGNK